ncbi:MAG: bifunctional (p)ppGpp synthetase/guanosine-3',5'-bis(diphosphate) 3'-pyrophosphohydrolase [Polyangiaceae bacterium]|nr:bifunctional (p)ppGpp synthetase/guanosine-3',5'-bis(diphosphate) 3'-pyrophosphohydrolase [Polyangiaceae bacterium]
MGTLLKRALDQAAVWHHGQLRKYPGTTVPYMSHPAGVAAILSRHGFDEEVVAAGALHDSIEDTIATIAEVEQLFGRRVADLVRAASEEDKTLSWEERKRAYLERFPHKPWEAQAITLADKIDNFESIIVCSEVHGDPWAMFKRGKAAQLERFDALAKLLDDLAPHPLILEYREALERVRTVPEGRA